MTRKEFLRKKAEANQRWYEKRGKEYYAKRRKKASKKRG